jgi:hypothetical protein
MLPGHNAPFEKMKKDREFRSEQVYDKNIGVPLLVTTSPVFDDEGQHMRI